MPRPRAFEDLPPVQAGLEAESPAGSRLEVALGVCVAQERGTRLGRQLVGRERHQEVHRLVEGQTLGHEREAAGRGAARGQAGGDGHGKGVEELRRRMRGSAHGEDPHVGQRQAAIVLDREPGRGYFAVVHERVAVAGRQLK
jgi:hypothetical protein